MRRHLVSDVPVGIFLSGGIDSTVMLALTREVLGPAADIRSFSIGFDDPEFDESGLAKRTAEHFGASHTEWKMTPEEGAAEIPAYLEAVDQPTIDGFNTWCVSKLARREGAKVVLSGLGGDEIFAGYGSFDRVPMFHTWYQRLGPLRWLLARLLDTRPPGTPWRRLAAFLHGNGGWLESYHAQRGIFTPQEAAALAETLSGEKPGAPIWELSGSPDDARDTVSQLEITRYMRNQLLRDSDLFSMAHGLELRVPFVDQRFLCAIQQIPAGSRLRQGKLLLLDAIPEVPDWVRNQPKKGFRFPFQHWMEGQFGGLLVEAKRMSPVPLKAWYRTWAVAVALHVMAQDGGKRKRES
jgi:asparagine synthase (glutamine-hydrolysing)